MSKDPEGLTTKAETSKATCTTSLSSRRTGRELVVNTEASGEVNTSQQIAQAAAEAALTRGQSQQLAALITKLSQLSPEELNLTISDLDKRLDENKVLGKEIIKKINDQYGVTPEVRDLIQDNRGASSIHKIAAFTDQNNHKR